MKRFKSAGQAQRFLSAHDGIGMAEPRAEDHGGLETHPRTACKAVQPFITRQTSRNPV